jgi:single-strand DNA-binding protein
MFDTYLTIVGNVLTAPEWRRTSQTNQLVANFKVASTARRLDRATNRWVDGNSLRVRVNCWRKLAEGVASSVMVGDPVIVAGRLYTRDWVDDEGQHRVMYEMEAVAVGHDLSRGRAKFARTRATTGTSAVDDELADARVNNEETELAEGMRVGPDPSDPFFAEDDDFSFGAPDGDSAGLAVASLRGSGLTAELMGPDDLMIADQPAGSPAGGVSLSTAQGEDDEEAEQSAADLGETRSSRRRRVPIGV